MSEFLCLYCSALSPEEALFCHICGHPIKCQTCQANLVLGAHYCTQCGNTIPENKINGQFPLERISSIPSGYNQLRLHKTPELQDVELLLTDVGIQQIKDFLPGLINVPGQGHYNSIPDHQSDKRVDVVEIASEETSPQPQASPSTSTPSLSEASPERLIWKIFSNHDGKIIQDMPKLKADSKKDYIVRLACLYLYAKLRLDEERTHRSDVYKILDDAGIQDTNRPTYINHYIGIQIENDFLRLNLDGRSQAQKYVIEAFNPDLKDVWYPGCEIKPANRGGHSKKPNKEANGQQNKFSSRLAGWLEHSETKALTTSVPHDYLVKLIKIEQALFALYGIEKTGDEQGATPSQIAGYLEKGYKVQVLTDSLEKALSKAFKIKSPFVNYTKGSGYSITPTGSKHVEELLAKQKSTSMSN